MLMLFASTLLLNIGAIAAGLRNRSAATGGSHVPCNVPPSEPRLPKAAQLSNPSGAQNQAPIPLSPALVFNMAPDVPVEQAHKAKQHTG
jgi:hypothetical protein